MKARSLLVLTPFIIFLLHAPASEKTTRKIQLGKPIDLHHAGLRISLPARQHLVVPDRGMLLRGKFGAGDNKLSETTVQAIPAHIIGRSVPTEAIAERMAAIFQKNAGFEKSIPVFSGPVRITAKQGWRIARRFSSKDRVQIVVITIWPSKITKQKATLYYVIGTILKGPDTNKALSMHEAICKSVKHIPFRSPSRMNLPLLLGPVELKSELFAIGVPRGWFLRSLGRQPGSSIVISTAALDYLRNILVPNMNVTVVSTSLNLKKVNIWSNKKECDEYIADLRKDWAKNSNRVYVSHRMAKIGDINGIEIASRTIIAGHKAVQVQRQVFHEGSVYTITVTWDGKNLKRAVAAINRFAGSVRFLKRPQPTTGAVTKPSTKS